MQKNIKKISASLLLLRFLKIAFSIFTLTLSAKYFGVSVNMDVWVIVTTVITTLNLAVWGPLNETFRAKFVFLREQDGEKPTLYKVRSLLLFIIVLTIALSLLLAFFSKSIIPLVAPSLAGSQIQFFTSILLIMIPTFLITEMISIGSSVLNAYSVFYMPEILGTVSAIINIICILLLAPGIGIKSLIIAQYISISIFLLFIFIYLRKSNIHFWSGGGSLRWKHISPFIYFAIPFFFPYIIAQFNNLLEKNLANSLGIGIVSILNYASQFKGIIQAVFTSVLVSVMVPLLASKFANRNQAEFASVFREFIQIVFISLSLIIPFLFGAAFPVANILYNHGGMNPTSIEIIVHLIRLYCISIISIMLYVIFGLTLLSQQKSYKYALQGVIAQVITILINIAWYRKIGPSIFPFSLVISHFLVSVIMFYNITLENKRPIITDLAKYILLILTLSSLLYLLSNPIDHVIKNSILQMMVYALLLLPSFLVFAYLLGFHVVSYAKLMISKFISVASPSNGK